MKKLFKFHWDCGRMGDVEGVFVADDGDVEKAIGKRVYFGEILGKHSDIFGTLDAKDLTVVTDNQDFIEKAVRYGIGSTGHNPLHYLSEEDS